MINVPPFLGSFTQQEAISDGAISSAVSILQSGRLHRYNTEANESSEVSLLEEEYAAYQGSRYCLACTSGGYALTTALRASGLKPGEVVLTNAFSLAPVPGAIVGAGGEPRFVEITSDLVLDLDDLEQKAASTNARFLMLSHMRGHLVDMARLAEIAEKYKLTVIEDCAHTMGAKWEGQKSGNFGLAGCFSTQTYKHMNSGEGGFITSDDAQFMARCILLSGSYMLYERHGAAPNKDVFETIRLETPNCSGRMDNLRATILRPQLTQLDDSISRWNERYFSIERQLQSCDHIVMAKRTSKEFFVGSSIQFRTPKFSTEQIVKFLDLTKQYGVELKWFGCKEPVAFTSTYKTWQYAKPQSLPQTDSILQTLFDMRIPLTFSLSDCHHISEIIIACADTAELKGKVNGWK